MSRSPKRFDIFESAPTSAVDPSDSVTSTLTASASTGSPSPSASPSVPRFVGPDLWDVQKFFELQIYPSQDRYAWESPNQFMAHWSARQWQRNGEPIEWQAEALRPKRVATAPTSSASTASQSPVPSTPVPSTATTSTPITRAIPTDASIAKSQIVAAILKAGES